MHTIVPCTESRNSTIMADQESVGSFLMQVAKVATDSNEWTTQKQLQRLSRPGSKSVAAGRIALAFVDMFMFAPVQRACVGGCTDVAHAPYSASILT